MKKLFFTVILVCLNSLVHAQCQPNEYWGLNDTVSNSHSIEIVCPISNSVTLSWVGLSSQLYSSDEGYYNLKQNHSARLVFSQEVDNVYFSLGVLRWGHVNEASLHRTTGELVLEYDIHGAIFYFAAYTDQYLPAFNLSLLYLGLEWRF
jgi:hypothetical protein